ncbi:MAG: RsmB/NOP family class I SAM-dependent RNA methyltransferase [Sulfuritalea sp.]|jgi:16S rRNA (cytosine967-C5)-methyltransferase|nr:RsmB/NOP family class I SAM-dependent RNA methyltransferase [Sulfuritalea sp.]MBK8761252.1 RsmB/NOP family class I SAM-dependent RNA methyltransferase [Sulfuritalea sp.]
MKKPMPSTPRAPAPQAQDAVGISVEQLNAAVAATALLLDFNQPADVALSGFFRAHRSGARDRAFIAETAYAVLRRKRLLERLAGPRPTPRQLVLLSLSRVRGMSQRQLDPALQEGEAEWLAGIRRGAEPDLTAAEQADLPDWLVERLLSRMTPQALQAMARALNTPAPLDLRVNSLKAERGAVAARLAADGIVAEPCAFAPLGLRLKGKPALQKHPAFLDGSFEVQDEGSQLLGYLLAPRRGEMVVDFCAGAGGKTLALGAMMRSTGRLYALDVSDKRLAKLKPRAARAGLSNVHPIRIAGENDIRVKRLAGKADRVLVDAPCSGLGTLRRNPDLKWRQSPQSVAELSLKQAAILAAAAKLVRPGGRLVYATCSILAEENEAIVDAFLAAHPGFRRLSARELLSAQGIAVDCGEDMCLAPQLHGTDGFYAAVLEREK